MKNWKIELGYHGNKRVPFLTHDLRDGIRLDDEAVEFIRGLMEVRERAGKLTEGLTVFEAGPDGDMCIWCRRERDRKIESWQQEHLPEFHDEDCDFIRLLAALGALRP